MTKKEARKILLILLTADQGCIVCTSRLFRMFIKEYPQFQTEADSIWKAKNGEESDFQNLR